MDHTFCPGATILRQPKPEFFSCPSCGEEVEIWSDELKARCPKCGSSVMKDKTLSCLDWCAHGKECVGDAVYDRYMKNRALCVKSMLIDELKAWFGDDTRRIDHALKVLGYAETMLEKETADWHIVIPACILHDVGIKTAEEKYGSSEGQLQEKEGPEIARKILFKAGLQKTDADEICAIIAHHHSPGSLDTPNFKVLMDADLLVNGEESITSRNNGEKETFIDTHFLTDSGKELARKVFL